MNKAVLFRPFFLIFFSFYILSGAGCERVSPAQNSNSSDAIGISGKPMMVNGPAMAAVQWKRVVFNDSGAGLALVSKYNGNQYSLFYSVFNAEKRTWSAETLLYAGIPNYELATDGDSFLMLFSVNNTMYSRVYSGGSWQGPKNLPGSEGNNNDFILCGSAGGYAAAFRKSDGIYGCVYSNGAWNYSERITTDTNISGNKLAADGAGGYCYMWNNWDGGISRYAVSVAVYDAVNDQWDGGSLLSGNLTYCQNVSLVSNGTGYCAVWHEFVDGGTDYDVMASVYDGTWAPKAAMDNTDSSWNASASSPVVASNGTTYCVAWYQDDGFNGRVAARTWSGAWDPGCEVLSAAGFNAYEVRIASDGATYAVTYLQYNTTTPEYSFHSNIYDGTWSASALLSDDSAGTNFSGFDLASDGTGYAAIWRQGPGTPDQDRYYSILYDGSNLGVPSIVDAGKCPDIDPPMIDSFNGGYYVHWIESSSAGGACYVNTYLSSAWRGPRMVASDNSGDGTCLGNGFRTAVTDSGVIMVLYQQFKESIPTIYGRIYNGSWGTPFEITGDINMQYYAVASNGTGFMVIYSDYGDDGNYHLYSRSYTVAGVSADTGEIGLPNPTSNPNTFNMASNGTGYCVTWMQNDSGNNGTFASVYNGTAWDTYSTIMATSAEFIKMISNGTGYCVLLSWYNGSFSEAHAAVYEANVWMPASRIDSLPYYVNNLNLATNGSTYCAVWSQYNGSYSYCYADRYEGGTWQGPEQMSITNNYAYDIGVAASGLNYCVAWNQNLGGQSRIYTRMFDEVSGAWGDLVTVDDPFLSMTNYYSFIEVVSIGDDLAVIWMMDDNSMEFNRIASVTYEGGLWNEIEIINSEVSINASYRLIARPGNTGYFIAWKGYFEGADSLLGAYYNGQWSGELLLENEPGYIEYGFTRIVPSGSAYQVFWFQRDAVNSSVYDVWTNRIVP